MPNHFDPEQNNRLFGAIVEHYDFCNHFFSLNIDQYWRRRLVRFDGFQDNACVLDVCTGTGDVAFGLCRYCQHAQIVALDVSHAMLVKACQKQVGRQNGDRLIFIEGDGLMLPFKEGTFDAVLICFGLRNQREYARALQEMQRVLKPGGCFAYTGICSAGTVIPSSDVSILFTTMPAIDRWFCYPAKKGL
ncbi:MAG: class I SAM-dependent methyltransferase [Candidatus Omnitrophica bacterium]|nr:class I SAM-dependent methyltransferase [Candidatus Omnitrophota bacterium]